MFQLFEANLQLVLPKGPVEEFERLIYCQLPILGSRHQQGSSAFAAQPHLEIGYFQCDSESESCKKYQEKFCERR